jgi:hypothetical protein
VLRAYVEDVKGIKPRVRDQRRVDPETRSPLAAQLAS